MLARLKVEWRLKLFLLLTINSVFWICYQFLSRHPVFPLREVPATFLDYAVHFQPEGWSWVYLSQFLVTGTLPWLLVTREDLRRCVGSMVTISLAGFAIFLFFPTRGPRPDEIGGNVALQWIARLDGPLNALPSMHAAYAVCMACLAIRLFGGKALWPAVAWVCLIFYSTLATKQHYALDLLTGAVLGRLADMISWRGASAAATMPVSRGMTSQVGER